MRNHPAAVVAPLAASVALVVWAILWIVGGSTLTAAAPAVAAGLAAAALLMLRAPRSALSAIGARPLARGEHPRIENIIDGLCTTHGFRAPSVHVVETPAINAASVGGQRPPAHLVVTRGALSELDRLELEAVVARQLCEIRRGVATETAMASVARIPGAGALARASGRGPDHERITDLDIEAVRLTGYPPGLASALSKAAASPSLDTSRAAAHLWCVTPQEVGSPARAKRSMAQRIDVLGEI